MMAVSLQEGGSSSSPCHRGRSGQRRTRRPYHPASSQNDETDMMRCPDEDGTYVCPPCGGAQEPCCVGNIDLCVADMTCSDAGKCCVTVRSAKALYQPSDCCPGWILSY